MRSCSGVFERINISGTADTPDYIVTPATSTDGRLHGTYNIVNHRMNLHGDMQVETKISKTSSGAKALLLKILDPNVPEKKKGEVVPRAHSRNSVEPEFGRI